MAKLRKGMSVYRMSKKIEIPRDRLRRTPIRGFFGQDKEKYFLRVEVAEGAFAGVTASCEVESGDFGEGEPLTWERAREQFLKTGQTPFAFIDIEKEGEFPILLRIAQINALRRDAMAFLAEALLDSQIRYRKRHFSESEDEIVQDPVSKEKKHIIIADYADMGRIAGGYACGADLYVFSALQVTRSGRIRYIEALLSDEPSSKIALRLPGAYKDDMLEVLEKAYAMVASCAKERFVGFFATHPMKNASGLLPGSNIFNRFAYRYEMNKGLDYLYLSYELNDEQITKLGANLRDESHPAYMAVHRYGPIEWMQSEFCPLGQHQKNCRMCQEHPEVSMAELSSAKNDLHHDSRVDIVCYPGFCRADLFGEAKNLISGLTVSELLSMGIPTASVARFMNEDQEERRMIVESFVPDEKQEYDDEEDWYEY